jgi:outer membrane immunogenic protein
VTWEGEVKKFLLAGFAFAALVAPAAAADMPIKALPPAPIDIWTGGYVGANVGYGWGNNYIDSVGSAGSCASTGTPAGTGFCRLNTPVAGASLNALSPALAQALTFNSTLNHSGLTYGGQAGHNWLVHNMFWTWDGVLGLEVDFQGLSDSHSATVTNGAQIAGFANTVTDTATFQEKLSTLGTVRGRAGLLWGPNTLVYATAGLAYANARLNGTYATFVNGTTESPQVPHSAAPYVNTELFGPVVGGGVEWKWTANWSVKAEYLYADLGNLATVSGTIQNISTTSGALVGSSTVQANSHVHENIARVGVNYRFW